MKLLTRTIIYYTLLSVPLLLLAGIAFYMIITSEVNKSMDESLMNTKKQLELYIETMHDTVSYHALDGDSFISFADGAPKAETEFRDTLIFDDHAHEFLPYRILDSEIPFGNGHHHIHIRKASIETEDLIDGIIISTLIVFAMLFVGLTGLSWWINRKLWKPFYDMLDYLKNYKIGERNNFSFVPSSITEFNLLNRSLDQMLQRIGRDYQKQKEFTENASHEMQTPVAVMQSKIDLLIQSKNLGDSEMKLIDQLSNALQKLSHLNRSLLLLSKIENKQFGESESVSVREVVQNSLSLFENAITSKQLQVTTHYLDSLTIQMNRGLCEILVNNLIQNAVRHNVHHGRINIAVNLSELVVKNTGNPIDNPTAMFDRFTKSDRSIGSIGLGLAIVKEIVKTSGFTISYGFQDDVNCFSISFL